MLIRTGISPIEERENREAAHHFDLAHVAPSPDAGFVAALC